MATAKTNQEIAIEVIAGKWGNGPERRQRLTEAGYSYSAVQSIVNAIMEGGYTFQPETPQQAPAETPHNLLAVELDLTKYDGLEVTLIK